MWNKLSTLPILAFILLSEPLQAIAQQAPPSAPQPPQWYYGPGPWHMWGDGHGWRFWWFFPLMMLFMFLVCAAVFLFVCSGWSHGSHHGGPPWRMMGREPHWSDPSYSALQILNERFARGEIQKDEYEDKKATILSAGRR